MIQPFFIYEMNYLLLITIGVGAVSLFSSAETGDKYSVSRSNASDEGFYNVKDSPFNAYGDGIHDDTKALNAALSAVANSGGTVFLPPGQYLTSATLVLSGTGVTLYGASNTKTTIIGNGTDIVEASCQQCKISDVSISSLSPTCGAAVAANSCFWLSLANLCISKVHQVGISSP